VKKSFGVRFRSKFDRQLQKRVFDLVVLAITLPIWFPLLLVLSVFCFFVQGRPLFFHQSRLGLGGEVFTIVKWRSMKEKYTCGGDLLPDENRITRFGGWLRRTSLDELPEIWCVLKGDMSLVGPRPLLPEYRPHFDTRQWQRHRTLPGITGLAQVNGRNSIEWDEKFEHDLEYVNSSSMPVDLRILARTVVVVFRGSGVESREGVPMDRFTGSENSEL
jgi:lipopolysaccharide/colanic/teichoic acid biosynthesis glycosyltransferase